MHEVRPDTPERFSFGDSPEMADRLLTLVLAGAKTATCSACCDGEPPAVGGRSIVLDGVGRPVALIETVQVRSIRFCDVDADFARDEGEGDGSLASWRAEHRAFFERGGGFDETMTLWCERFRLVRVLTPDPS